MTGRVTLRNISRWTPKGGSYRTVQRFFTTVIPWGTLCWVFFREHLRNAESENILVGDESTVAKAGDQTYGLGRFFSSVLGKPVPGVSFFAVSLVSIAERRSYPMRIEPIVKDRPATPPSTETPEMSSAETKRKPGRPKGSRPKTEVVLSNTLRHLQITGHITTEIYQAELRSPSFTDTLNVVCVLKTNNKTQRYCHKSPQRKK